MARYICIHGHFYQPPRENPWLDAIELQPSAHPYHDWNERIAAECYAPNAASRILDESGETVEIRNNYAGISYDFGPTLLNWMETGDPQTYRAVLEADRLSRAAHGGHGCAMAQAYNHAILPLCNARDLRTQVLWGLRDFEARFERPTEGMWLPETAVDLATLEVLAETGVRFTVLAPQQAAAVRPLAGGAWTDVTGGGIDTRRAYRARLPSGRQIALFFYDGPISSAVAFEQLLSSGARFEQRLLEAFEDAETPDPLVHIATDGETYGHHHAHGDMALAFVLRSIDSRDEVRRTHYAEYLARHPATHEVRIVENSSWSCAHGVGRWSEDCGCASDGPQGRQQRWRAPLRAALDWLRDRVAPEFERRGRELLVDPWAARDDYIDVVLNREPAGLERFLRRHGRRPLAPPECKRVVDLLELQRYALLMYTSCAWFFEELSRIETIQVLRYAGRALELARETLGRELEPSFLERLEQAPSNLEEVGNGRRLYEREVLGARRKTGG